MQASLFPHAPHSNQVIRPTERTLKTQVSKKALKEELSAVKEAQLQVYQSKKRTLVHPSAVNFSSLSSKLMTTRRDRAGEKQSHQLNQTHKTDLKSIKQMKRALKKEVLPVGYNPQNIFDAYFDAPQLLKNSSKAANMASNLSRTKDTFTKKKLTIPDQALKDYLLQPTEPLEQFISLNQTNDKLTHYQTDRPQYKPKIQKTSDKMLLQKELSNKIQSKVDNRQERIISKYKEIKNQSANYAHLFLSSVLNILPNNHNLRRRIDEHLEKENSKPLNLKEWEQIIEIHTDYKLQMDRSQNDTNSNEELSPGKNRVIISQQTNETE